jgi:hypothetical protein
LKSARDQLRWVLASKGEIEKLVIVFKVRGEKPKAVHTFERMAEALAFVNEVLRLSDDELLEVFRGRQ